MLKDPIKRRITLSYLFDWILVIIMTVVFFAIDNITPFHRQFSIHDKTIMFPYAEHERVPVWLLLVICFVIPFAIIGGITLSGLGYKRNIYDFHAGVLGLCLGLSMTIMLTDVIKITAGRPRPDMLSRCKPALDAEDPPLGLSTVDICTTDIHSHIMIDGFKSFPSGHSSFSFAGLGYLSFYMAGKLRLFDEKGHTYKGFCCIFPFIGAALVAISRTEDYRHHWHDVFIGALLGTVCAYFAYRQYYPALGHNACHTPFMTRMLYWQSGLDNSNNNNNNTEHRRQQDEEEACLATTVTSSTASSSHNHNNDHSNIFNHNTKYQTQKGDQYSLDSQF
ncbi:acid phosphatase/Vanadium-dependent haloperoxidase [Rhizopus microsporus var. microsporus]|uniref:Acid phosphatase/Vanadium-dependent haloperoxidase n=1 Tax=Rhizopus microsporus var. microsporus TaxID=86635 RepID=A0A1X0QYS2_RHIZD|nr:acid phosphatase/Vanadium-dependent haloperoxidase [Rhizopus microsporus var. microsporus]